ncbi:MAG: phosphoribosylaminoimidazolesuccinocarboxamide synthase [Peptococcaceae bacterium]|nr:phosphoribosylaminoimidazolesuccinocarboxamide synthase [Peptococcaceae bacterium]
MEGKTMTSGALYEGKSKTVYPGEREDECLIRFRDTATAFNGEKKEELQGKGRLNAEFSNLVFEFLAKNGVQTHLIKVVDETSILAKKAEIVMVEVVVRNLAAGSFSKKYGVPEGTALRNTVLEFSLKSDEYGDPMMNETQITALGLAAQAELDEMSRQALRINGLLSGLLARAGIKLVDFKLEFGRYQGGIILCDEITPDSCRFWDAGTHEKLDKDRFRLNLGGVLEGYQNVLGRVRDVVRQV